MKRKTAIILAINLMILFSCSPNELVQGRGFIFQKDYVKAMQNLSVGVQLYPNNHEMKYWYSLALYEVNKFDEAVLQIEEAYRMQPDNSDYKDLLLQIYKGVGSVKHKSGDYTQALHYFKKYYALKPNDSGINVWLSRVYFLLGEYEKSQKYLNLLKEIDPQHVFIANSEKVISEKGIHTKKLKAHKEKREKFETSYQTMSIDSVIHYLYYTDYFEAYEKKPFLEFLETQPLSDKQKSYTAYLKAAIDFHNNNYGLAAYHFLKIKSSDKELMAKRDYSIARCFREMDDYKKAREYYRKVAKDYPDSYLADDALFMDGYLEQDWEKSIPVYEKLLKRYPDSEHNSGVKMRLENIFVITGNIEAYSNILNYSPMEKMWRIPVQKMIERGFINKISAETDTFADQIVNSNDLPWIISDYKVYKNDPSAIDFFNMYYNINSDVSIAQYFKKYARYRDIQSGPNVVFGKSDDIQLPDTIRTIEVADVYFSKQRLSIVHWLQLYQEALKLDGSDSLKEAYQYRIIDLLYKYKFYSAALDYIEKIRFTDPYLKYLAELKRFDFLKIFNSELYKKELPTFIINNKNQRGADKCLLNFTDWLAPDIAAMRKNLELVVEYFPQTDAGQAAAERLLRLAYYADMDYAKTSRLAIDLKKKQGAFFTDYSVSLNAMAMTNLGRFNEAISTCTEANLKRQLHRVRDLARLENNEEVMKKVNEIFEKKN
jgi:tetratricopeptide (TPR) repeat protein